VKRTRRRGHDEGGTTKGTRQEGTTKRIQRIEHSGEERAQQRGIAKRVQRRERGSMRVKRERLGEEDV